MRSLCDDDDLFDPKDKFGPSQTFIGRKSRMIHKDIAGDQSLIDRVVFHDVDFIVIDLTMIPTHE